MDGDIREKNRYFEVTKRRKNPYSKGREKIHGWMDASRHTKKSLLESNKNDEKTLTLKEGKKIHGWMHRDIREKNPYFEVTKR